MKRFGARVVSRDPPRSRIPPRAPLLTLNSGQLSRGKDSSKSSKKNKDSKDGTASPNAAARDANQSPVLTPSSSTSTLNDPRNKPLPPNNAAHADHAALAAQAQLGNAGAAPGIPDRFGGGGVAGQPQGANGGSTPARLGPLPPTVIISPSAPVSRSRCYPIVVNHD